MIIFGNDVSQVAERRASNRRTDIPVVYYGHNIRF